MASLPNVRGDGGVSNTREGVEIVDKVRWKIRSMVSSVTSSGCATRAISSAQGAWIDDVKEPKARGSSSG